jgi:hypothetical protein
MIPAGIIEDDYAQALAAYETGSLEHAGQKAQAILRRNPRHVPALMLAGVVAAQRLELESAVESFDRALAIQPGNPRAQFNKACVLLLEGDWVQGLPLYESRWHLTEPAPDSSLIPVRTAWRGQELLAGKRILLRCEQGMGDTLQFCRYVPLIAARGASVVLEAQRPLMSLLADLPGLTRIVTQGAPLPPCDYECPLMSLPLAFGTTPASIPHPVSYLTSDPGKVAEWRARLGPATGLRIGLAWRGNALQAHDRRRSVPLRLLREHLPSGHQYVSLQKEPSTEEIRLFGEPPRIVDCTAELHDFSDTAALCACLDLVISIDTSVAHLAAGLGRPTWILLPYSPGWRWLLARDDSPWYSSAVLLRQTRVDEWSGVCARVNGLVAELVRSRSAA